MVYPTKIPIKYYINYLFQSRKQREENKIKYKIKEFEHCHLCGNVASINRDY